MRSLLVMCLFCVPSYAVAGSCATPSVAHVPVPQAQVVTVPQPTVVQQQVVMVPQTQTVEVEKQITEYVPQTRTEVVQQEVQVMVPQVQTVAVQQTNCCCQVQRSYTTQTCNCNCSPEVNNAAMALYYAEKALADMDAGGARGGELRRARRAVAHAAIRLKAAKRRNEIHAL